MRETLAKLNSELGLLGSMVMTPDGIMVAAALGPGYDEEATAALVSAFVVPLKRSFAALGRKEGFASCTLSASRARVLLVDMKNSYLVVIARPEERVDAAATAVQNAIHRIKNRRVA